MLELIRESSRHLSADEVYHKLKREFPKVSLGTVYRNLTVLSEQGVIRKLDFFNDFDRFDAITADHYHFLCDRCHNVYDLQIPVDRELDERVSKATGHQIDSHRLEFLGVCSRCAHGESNEAVQ